MLQNLHTHTHFSDGSSAPEQYVEAALAQGLTSLGFSDHSPLPFENTFALREEKVAEYCDTILSLKHFATLPLTYGRIAMRPYHSPLTYGRIAMRPYHSPLTIFLGMEADFIPGMGHPFSHFWDTCPLDYLIGSVHLVRNGSPEDLWFIDGPDPATYDQGLNELFGGDIRKGVAAYYRQINEMLTTGRMDIVGHLDKIKMHNRGRFFTEDEPWYQALVDETLELVMKKGVIVEVNTRGIYKKRSDSLFPGPAILKKIHAMGIPVLISSDAHKPGEVSMLFAETAELLRNIGFGEVMNLTQEGWEGVAFC